MKTEEAAGWEIYFPQMIQFFDTQNLSPPALLRAQYMGNRRRKYQKGSPAANQGSGNPGKKDAYGSKSL